MKSSFTRWFLRLFRRSDPLRAGSAADRVPVSATSSVTMPMLDCESVMRQLWDYLDGELTEDRTAAIRAHLELCKRCFPQHEFERSFLDAVASRAPVHTDPERLQRKLIAALHARGMSET